MADSKTDPAKRSKTDPAKDPTIDPKAGDAPGETASGAANGAASDASSDAASAPPPPKAPAPPPLPDFDATLEGFFPAAPAAPAASDAPLDPDVAKHPVRARLTALWSGIRRNAALWIVFAAVLFFFLWRIGSYPAYFNEIVPHMIHVQVDKLIEGISDAGTVTWYWTAMYTHQAYTSPIYAFFIDLGLRLFGLTLFGVRLPLVLFDFVALLVAYFALRKHLPKPLVLTFVLLLGLSPWNLLYARSGGIFALSVGMYLLAIAMPLLLAGRKRNVAFAVLAGLSVAMLPYGYAGLRLVAPLVLLLVFYLSRRFQKTNYLAYMGTAALFVLIQFFHADSFKEYFNARGEGLNTVAKLADGSYDIPLLLTRLQANAITLANQLLGLNGKGHYLQVNLAENFYRGDVVLYPKFLAPFLVMGLLFCFYDWLWKKKGMPALLLLFFALGLVPGLMAGVGSPNLSRELSLLVPVYLVIAYGVYHSFAWIHSLAAKRRPGLAPALLVAFVLAVSAYQVDNFFDNTKDGGSAITPQARVYHDVLQTFYRDHPGGTVLYHDFSPFYVYDYVKLEWVGQGDVRTWLADGRLTFVRADTQEYVHKRLLGDQFDLVVTTDPSTLERIYPEVLTMYVDREDGYTLYTKEPVVRDQLFLPTPTPTPTAEPTAPTEG